MVSEFNHHKFSANKHWSWHGQEFIFWSQVLIVSVMPSLVGEIVEKTYVFEKNWKEFCYYF